MAAIDKIKAHFDAIGNRTINVPEWDLVIHATPVSISERKAIYSGIEESDGRLAPAQPVRRQLRE